MERYLGLDAHAASCTLAVISEKGRKLRDFPVETETPCGFRHESRACIVHVASG